jgi:hypothetical protein
VAVEARLEDAPLVALRLPWLSILVLTKGSLTSFAYPGESDV